MKEKTNNPLGGIKKGICNMISADKMHHNTGVISIIASLVLLLAIYISFANVDLVFKQDDVELFRMEKVTVFSNLDVSDEEVDPEIMEDFEKAVFTYTSGDSTKTFSDSFEFRFEICKTVLLNFVTFKWDNSDNDIILNAG